MPRMTEEGRMTGESLFCPRFSNCNLPLEARFSQFVGFGLALRVQHGGKFLWGLQDPPCSLPP